MAKAKFRDKTKDGKTMRHVPWRDLKDLPTRSVVRSPRTGNIFEALDYNFDGDVERLYRSVGSQSAVRPSAMQGEGPFVLLYRPRPARLTSRRRAALEAVLSAGLARARRSREQITRRPASANG